MLIFKLIFMGYQLFILENLIINSIVYSAYSTYKCIMYITNLYKYFLTKSVK